MIDFIHEYDFYFILSLDSDKSDVRILASRYIRVSCSHISVTTRCLIAMRYFVLALLDLISAFAMPNT